MGVRGWLRAVLGREGRVEKSVRVRIRRQLLSAARSGGRRSRRRGCSNFSAGCRFVRRLVRSRRRRPFVLRSGKETRHYSPGITPMWTTPRRLAGERCQTPLGKRDVSLQRNGGPGRSTFPALKPPSNVTEFTGTSRAQPSLHFTRTGRNRKPLPATGGTRNRIGDGAGSGVRCNCLMSM